MITPQTRPIFDDPIVAEVRKAGDDYFRQDGYDIHKTLERLREAERRHPERIATTAGSQSVTR